MSDAVAPDALKAALETFFMESQISGASFDESVRAALAAGIRANEQRFRARIAEEAETYAREMVAAEDDPDDEEGVVPAFAVALGWFADKVREGMDLNPSAEYEPAEGDVVEVTVVGEVGTRAGGITRCWTVVDDYTGLELLFPVVDGVRPQVRVLSRAAEQVPQNLSGEEQDSGQEDQ